MADPLLQPFQLKHLTLKNRIISTSHEPAYSEEALPKARYRLYHEEKAKGGIGMTMIGGSSIVAPDSPQAFGNLYVGSDAIIPWFGELRRRRAQIRRGGDDPDHPSRPPHLLGQGGLAADHLALVQCASRRTAPSRRRWRTGTSRAWSRPMAPPPRRCNEGGLDGIEIECLRPPVRRVLVARTNKRADEYGGCAGEPDALHASRCWKRSAQGRATTTSSACDGRRRAGRGRPRPARTALTIAGAYGGARPDRLRQRHPAAISAPTKRCPTSFPAWDAGVPASRLRPRGEARVTKLPIMHAAAHPRRRDRRATRSPRASRPRRHDPRPHGRPAHRRARSCDGRGGRIRPCVGTGYCIDRIYQGGEALCIHNPATGREATMPHVITPTEGPRRKRSWWSAPVPAGLEAARVAARARPSGRAVRGRRQAGRAGAAGGEAAAPARDRRHRRLAAWRRCERLGVEIRFNTYAEAPRRAGGEPGHRRHRDRRPAATPGASSSAGARDQSWDVLAGQVPVAPPRSCCSTTTARIEGSACAEFVVDQAPSWNIVTPERALGVDVGGINYPAYFKKLYAAKTPSPSITG